MSTPAAQNQFCVRDVSKHKVGTFYGRDMAMVSGQDVIYCLVLRFILKLVLCFRLKFHVPFYLRPELPAPLGHKVIFTQLLFTLTHSTYYWVSEGNITNFFTSISSHDPAHKQINRHLKLVFSCIINNRQTAFLFAAFLSSMQRNL